MENYNHEGKLPVKFADTANSEEVLVFTSSFNVYKVPRKDIYGIQQALDMITFEEGERPLYLTGDKGYSGFLIVAFSNGKVGKISMTGYKTEYKRKKLINAFNNDSELVFIERIDNDTDLVAISSIKKVILFNTSLINPVESRTTKGVQVMKQKDGSSMVRVMKASQASLADPDYYRKGLNVVGFYLKPGDKVE